MKVRIFIFALCILTLKANTTTEHQLDKIETTLTDLEKPRPQTVLEQDNSAKEILKTFAGMVINFLSIVKDPHNSGNVQIQIANMLAGMVSIAMEMFKSGRLDESTLEAYDLDPEFIALLKAEFIKAAHEME